MRGTPRLRLLLVMLVLTAFTLTALDARSTGGGSPFDAVRRGSDAVFGPALRLVGVVAHAVGGAVGGLPRIGDYRSENAALRRENDRLRSRLRASDGLRRQAAEWNALLKVQDASDYRLLPARVISVGSSLGFEWTATLDAGSRDGIRENATVLNGRGLVGRVKRVGPYTSTVVLVVDGQFSVGVRLLRSGQLGIATGRGLGPLSYELVGQRARAEPGEAMYTSGSTLAAGIPVGRVTSTSSDPNSPTLTGLLQPYVDVTSLDVVAVVLDGVRGSPRAPLGAPVLPSATAGPTGTRP